MFLWCEQYSLGFLPWSMEVLESVGQECKTRSPAQLGEPKIPKGTGGNGFHRDISGWCSQPEFFIHVPHEAMAASLETGKNPESWIHIMGIIGLNLPEKKEPTFCLAIKKGGKKNPRSCFVPETSGRIKRNQILEGGGREGYRKAIKSYWRNSCFLEEHKPGAECKQPSICPL